MEFINWLNAIHSYNITIFLIATSILSSLCFGVLFSSDDKLAFSSTLDSLLMFSLFFFSLIFYIFGCDISSVILSGSYFFNQSFQMFFLFFSILVLITTRDFTNARKVTKFEYDTLFSFVVLSGILLCFANDFLLIYLAIELQSLCFYVLATFNRNSEFSTESGLKYFVFGAIISCFLLFGFSILYISFGITSFESLAGLIFVNSDAFLFLGLLFILVPFLFKVGAAPFHS
jgi:NADH-quinone oxidoreductase subunit N